MNVKMCFVFECGDAHEHYARHANRLDGCVTGSVPHQFAQHTVQSVGLPIVHRPFASSWGR